MGTKRSGIRIKKVKKHGNVRWQINVPASFLGRRRRFFRESEAGAYAFADELEGQVREYGRAWRGNGRKNAWGGFGEVLDRSPASRVLAEHARAHGDWPVASVRVYRRDCVVRKENPIQ